MTTYPVKMQIIPIAKKKKKQTKTNKNKNKNFINGEHLFGIKVRTNRSICGTTLQIRRIFWTNFDLKMISCESEREK